MNANNPKRAERTPGLSAALRILRRIAALLAASLGLMAAGLTTAQAAIVNAVFTDLGGGGNTIQQSLKLSITAAQPR